MSTFEPSSGAGDDARPTASAALKLQTEKVELRAQLNVPGDEAPNVVQFARHGLLLLTGVVCLVLAGGVAMAPPTNGLATAIVVAATLTAGVIAIGAATWLMVRQRSAPSTSTPFVITAGRSTVHPFAVRPPRDGNDPRPQFRRNDNNRRRAARAAAKRRRRRGRGAQG